MTTTDLNDTNGYPFGAGMSELTVRVSRYDFAKDPAGVPAAYQCFIDHRDRRVPRSVGIRANPVAAIHAALTAFARHAAETPLPGKMQKRLTRASVAAEAGEPEPKPVAIDPDLEDLI